MFKESIVEKLVVGSVVAMPVILIVLFVVGVSMSCLSDATGHSHDVAQKQADAFMRSAGINAKAICANSDTDQNGYISCPYATPDGVLHPLECSAALTMNNGCRVPRALLNTTGEQ